MAGEKIVFSTARAPAAIGAYSQAVRGGDLVFISGQIPLDPQSGEMAVGRDAQIRQTLDNLDAVCAAAGATRDDIVKLTVFLVDLEWFGAVNDAMTARFARPFPARAAVGVAALPKNAGIEIEAIVAVPR